MTNASARAMRCKRLAKAAWDHVINDDPAGLASILDEFLDEHEPETAAAWLMGFASDASQSAFHEACRRGRSQCAVEMIKRGLPPDGPIMGTRSAQALGLGPLGLAAHIGDCELGAYLIGAGADIERMGLQGERPLRIAAERNNFGMVEMLIAAGAELDVIDAPSSALAAAVRAGGEECMFALLEAGADPAAIFSGGVF